MKWSIHIYDPKTETTTTRVKDYPGTSASMADAPAVVAKASRDFKKHMKYILAVPHHGGHATKKKKSTASKKIKISTSRPIGWTITDPARPGWSETGTTTTAELRAKQQTKHATKKSAAELQRDIDDALRAADRKEHGYDTDYLSERDYAQAARFESKKYGLSQEEAIRLAKHPRYLSIREDVESWRAKHGFPAANSPLARGYLLSKLR